MLYKTHRNQVKGDKGKIKEKDKHEEKGAFYMEGTPVESSASRDRILHP